MPPWGQVVITVQCSAVQCSAVQCMKQAMGGLGQCQSDLERQGKAKGGRVGNRYGTKDTHSQVHTGPTQPHVVCVYVRMYTVRANSPELKVYIAKTVFDRSKGGQRSTWKNTRRSFVLRSMLSNSKINIIINSSHLFSVATPVNSN